MKVEKFGNRYYLLSTVQNENKLFAFQLKKSWGKLKLKKYGFAVCSCELKDKPVNINSDIFIGGNRKYLACKEGIKTSSIFMKK